MIAQLNKSYILAGKFRVFPRLLSYFFFEGRPATTKGRWFNPVTFLAIKLSSHTAISENSEAPVFITGTGRSGSTILGMILSIHPDAGFLNEPKALWFLANPKDDIIGSYSNGKADYIMNESHANGQIKTFVNSVYTSFLNISGAKKIIDKFPEMIFRVEFLNTIFKNPKYIFLYRNPWETISSTANWSGTHRDMNQKEDWWGVNNRKWNLLVEQVVPFDEMLAPYKNIISEFNNENDKAAVEWILTMNQGIKMLQRFPEKVLAVKYEELVNKPESILTNIREFCNLKPNAAFLNFGINTLAKPQIHNKITLHPVLTNPLEILSEKLGYNIYSPSMSVTE